MRNKYVRIYKDKINMIKSLTLREELKALMAEKPLLKHPFYQLWNQGKLPMEAMRKYAEQYYHLEKNFPLYLSRMHAKAGDDFAARQEIVENLYDEEHGENNHRMLWLKFAVAIGCRREEVETSRPLPETQAAVDTFLNSSDRSMIEGVGALAAYESQQPEVAKTKMAGLQKYYGITSKDGLEFFRVHGVMDVAHAEAWWKLIDASREPAENIRGAVRAGRDALWGFLDGIMRAYLPEYSGMSASV